MYQIKNVTPLKMKIRALTNKTRKRIIDLLEKEGRMCVTDIYTRLGLDQGFCSLHLKILRQENFVNTHKQGKLIFYELDKEEINKALELAKF